VPRQPQRAGRGRAARARAKVVQRAQRVPEQAQLLALRRQVLAQLRARTGAGLDAFQTPRACLLRADMMRNWTGPRQRERHLSRARVSARQACRGLPQRRQCSKGGPCGGGHVPRRALSMYCWSSGESCAIASCTSAIVCRRPAEPATARPPQSRQTRATEHLHAREQPSAATQLQHAIAECRRWLAVRLPPTKHRCILVQAAQADSQARTPEHVHA